VRGTLAELSSRAAELRGEVTLVIDGTSVDTTAPELTESELDQAIAELLAQGNSVRDIVQLLLVRSGLPRQALYAHVQAIRDDSADD